VISYVGGYIKRNLARWSAQYAASKTAAELPMMDRLTTWLEGHLPADDRTTLIHGDYRLDNLIFDDSSHEVLAVLDWEMSTLGHPLVDLADSCRMYHLPTNFPFMPCTLRYVTLRYVTFSHSC